MRLSIQRFRWVLLAGAVVLIIVLAAFIGYGRYRALQAYRQVIARSGVSITHDSNGVTYSQSVKGRQVFTLRAKTESDLGNGKYALHNAELVLDDHNGKPAERISGSEIEYDQNEGVARAAGEVYMDIEPPKVLTNSGAKAAGPSGPGGSAGQPVTFDDATQVIHVRTSGLVYVRKLGAASTTQKAEFTFGQMRCTSLGAVFNANLSTLDLLSNVHLDGLAHGHPLHVTALRANMDRNTNIANLSRPVATSEGRTARADRAILFLRKDGSLQRVQGFDHVILTSGTEDITASRMDAWLSPQSVLQSARLSGQVFFTDTNPQLPRQGSAQVVDAVFDAKGLPTRVVGTGAVKLSEIDRRGSPRGLGRSAAGERVVVLFAPAKKESGHRSSSGRNSTQVQEIDASGGASAGGESLAARAAHGSNSSSTPPQLKNSQIWADDLRLLFVTKDGQTEPKSLYGVGHTVLRQDAPLGAQQISTGDTLSVAFASAPRPAGKAGASPAATSGARPGPGEAVTVAAATQSGHVTVRNRAAETEPKPKAGEQAGQGMQPGAISTGSAQRATYLGATDILTLSGDAHLYDANGSITAPTISMNQQTGNADAGGGVQGAFQNASSSGAGKAGGAAASGPELQPVTHVLASTAHFDHAAQLATFYGSDQAPARMWQQASQVQAARLIFDGRHRIFSARPAQPGVLIHAVFASNPAAQGPAQHGQEAAGPKASASPASGRQPSRPGGAGERAPSIIRVASPKMDYNDLQREAFFSDGVTMLDESGEVHGRRAVVYLTPAAGPAHAAPSASSPGKSTVSGAGSASSLAIQPNPLGNSIDHVVVSGAVQIEQPGRHGTGEQLVYTAAQGAYLLTGTAEVPPRIVDAQQGNITGTSLLFGDAGSTIVVTGKPGGAKGKGGRVRTETHVSSGREEMQ
ncbi:MAG: hypothetical protein ACLGQU_09725 [Acidobacteriota bacterium]